MFQITEIEMACNVTLDTVIALSRMTHVDNNGLAHVPDVAPALAAAAARYLLNGERAEYVGTDRLGRRVYA